MPQWFLRFSEFPQFTEFNESSAPFRENSIVPWKLTPRVSEMSEGVNFQWNNGSDSINYLTPQWERTSNCVLFSNDVNVE